MVKLGDKVRDTISGFEGIVTARTEWLTGCVRFGVESERLEAGKLIDAQWFDELRLTGMPAAAPGGPMPDPKRTSDPRR